MKKKTIKALYILIGILLIVFVIMIVNVGINYYRGNYNRSNFKHVKSNDTAMEVTIDDEINLGEYCQPGYAQMQGTCVMCYRYDPVTHKSYNYCNDSGGSSCNCGGEKCCQIKESTCSKQGAGCSVKYTTCGCSCECPTQTYTPVYEPDPDPACYQLSNGTYSWLTYAPAGSTLVSGVNNMDSCNALNPHCYINSYNQYVWDTLKSGYTLVSDVTDDTTCKNKNPACFKKSDGTYVWGTYSLNNNYTLISSATNETACNELNTACYRKEIESQVIDGKTYKKYDYKWTTKDKVPGYTKVDNIKNETDCILEDTSIPNQCLTSSIYSPKSNNASTCSGNTTLSLDDEKVCSSSITNQFYTINCRETINANFKPGNLSVKAGQGFKYNINVTSSNTCAGVFNDTEWNDAYNKAKKLYNRADKANDEYEKAWYNKIISDLEDLVINYNNANSNYSNGLVSAGLENLTGQLELKYKANKIDTTLTYSFIKGNTSVFVTDNIPTNKETKTLANNMSVSKFNVTINNSVELIPPKVYLDKNGNEVTQGTPGAIDGGNLFLTDLKTDKSSVPYNMVITLNNLGVNRNGTITNYQCGLIITKESNDITYRIIDVGNPFGIDAVTPGNNWSNTNFNFRETIDKNTWSGEYLYKFDLTSQDIKNIKEDNSKWSGLSAYRGVCNENETILSREFKETVCDELNK